MNELVDHLPPWPEQDFAQFGEIAIKPVGRNWVAIPHVTHHDEADVTALEADRKRWNAAHPDARRTRSRILGTTKLQPRPLPASDGGFAWRDTLPLSLSYDHHVVNGADAARFVRKVADELAAFRFGE